MFKFFHKHWLVVFLTLLITGLVLVSVQVVYAGTLSCSVTTAAACTGTVIWRMSGASNAHAELYNQTTPAYDSNVVCCTGVAGLENLCSGTYATPLKLSGLTNAHVQEDGVGIYANSVCISAPTGGSVSVGYRSGGDTCATIPAYDTTLGSMVGTTNSHVGNGGWTAGTTKICATAAGAAGALTVDIVDAGGNPVVSPSMAMGAITFSFTYQTSNGTFGVSDQKIRVNNTTANPQWTLSIAASNGSDALWSNAGETKKYDFNDPTANAEDGSDSPDTVGGQMTINASGSTLGGTCSATDITKGSSTSFSEDVIDSAPLLTAGALADTGCYWDLTNVSVSQTIPASQGIDTSYTLNLVLTVTPGP